MWKDDRYSLDAEWIEQFKDDNDWWQQQTIEREEYEHYEFVRTLLLATLIAIYKELETVEGKLQ